MDEEAQHVWRRFGLGEIIHFVSSSHVAYWSLLVFSPFHTPGCKYDVLRSAEWTMQTKKTTLMSGDLARDVER